MVRAAVVALAILSSTASMATPSRPPIGQLIGMSGVSYSTLRAWCVGSSLSADNDCTRYLLTVYDAVAFTGTVCQTEHLSRAALLGHILPSLLEPPSENDDIPAVVVLIPTLQRIWPCATE